jgi:Asp-tRNA(Asn)/Glu-tRNA(Gln) amidotransferase B subunit
LLGSEATAAQTDQVSSVVDQNLDVLVLAAISKGVDPALALRRTANEAAADSEHARSLDPVAYSELLRMEQQGELTSTQAKTVLTEMLASGGDPSAIATAKGFESLGDDSLGIVVREVVDANPAEWDRYRNGDDADRKKLAGFFTGLIMRATNGKASGRLVAEELERLRG